MRGCDEELCPNWGGDGRVCECVQLDIEPGKAAGSLHGLWDIVRDEEVSDASADVGSTD